MTGPFSGSRSPCELCPLNSNPEHAQGEPGGHGGRGPRQHRARREEHHGRRGLADKPLSTLTDWGDWQTSCGANWQTNLSADWQTNPYIMDWQIYISEWSGRLILRGLADQLRSPHQSGCSTLQLTGRQTREWIGRDLTPGQPAGRLSLWWTLENRFKKDFFRTENPLLNIHRGEKYSRKKPVSPTAFVHV